MARQRQWPSDYDPNNWKKKRWDIPTLERRARSQGAGKFIPGLTENAVERAAREKKLSEQMKKNIAGKSRPYWTDEHGGRNIKRTGVAHQVMHLDDLERISETEEALKQSLKKTTKPKVKKTH